ncbi:ATP5D [Cordylochernes scorpioides]|uniref:ATP5D n=1 Tax=Cordylochernes scorpioides TaxID=51811 RepID=A0ABY6KRS5_9ARAC|nr:ATP5D [Cordylochernes scorpioides]
MNHITRAFVPLIRNANKFHKYPILLSSRTYADGMPLTFASPSQVYYDQASVKQIDVPSFSGSFGILPKHVPCLAVLKPGVVTIYEEDGSNKKYFVSSGSISIHEDSSVQVLAEEAIPVDQIDKQAAQSGLATAQQHLTSASSDLERAEAQIEVEVHEALVKAAE